MKLKPWLKAAPGRASALAARLNVTRSMVSQMANGDVPVPPRMYRAIRDFTNNEVAIEDLLPEDGTAAISPASPPDTPTEDRRTGADRRERDVPIAFGNRRHHVRRAGDVQGAGQGV
jgi:transcriptional regulator with XRE-family HTH domain